MLLGYLNVNSIRHKLHDFFSLTKCNFDILCIAETKLESSFQNKQFEIKGYKNPFKLDITERSGGLLVYVKHRLSSTRLKSFSLPDDIEIVPYEIRIKSCKWLIVSIYRNPNQDLDYGDFNTEPHETKISKFIDSHELYNHVKLVLNLKKARLLI